MLTCYDYTSATLMQAAGVPMLLVGDSAAGVILGHPSTLPVSLQFMIEITAAVRRGAPNCLVVGDMPFGSYQASDAQGAKNVLRLVKLTGCDCVKLEVAARHASLVSRLADAGVAVMVHLGLRPQAVGLMGGYRAQGRSALSADSIVSDAIAMQSAGAAAVLLEAVPPEVSQAVVDTTEIPVIGCGAGPACSGHVVVGQDILGLTPHRPKFAPLLKDLSADLKSVYADYVQSIASGRYPLAEHQYEMSSADRSAFMKSHQLSQTSNPTKENPQ